MKNIIFKPWCNNRFKGCYKHLVTKDFDRITISYGFYNRNKQKTKQTEFIPVKNGCIFDFPFNEGWYFGVNLRIKCQQRQNQNKNNINIATQISQNFCRYTIPHYLNGADHGVDFFVFPIIIGNKKSLNDFLDGWCNAIGFRNILVQNIFENIPANFEDFEIINNPNDIDNWVENKMNELLRLLQDVNMEE
ncbi:MAG: hypothetical protein KAT68_11190 [Bacteroidales bacterium]|nr:hypothetical protein [Bacteroidales bacterium]